MATLSCPRCHQLIDSQAITCPHCRITLKAFGHRGIPLHRAVGNEYLCETCVYHQDDSCNFPKRPYAQDCTLYQNWEESQLELEKQTNNSSLSTKVKSWIKRNQGLVLLIAILFVCLLISLTT
ncbi:zinc ribbon domain-containing protein [Sphaerospermopsis torques-reginae]|uniref:Zinc ribbon domain-containing protein n=1 Tax=Sphaerospermopsis torques-reginae ITEP-024 TaxID=984208 RepID=A0ABX8X3I5_9CYAN|nr:zinc ribbon domain-containing protein [Sphaerospermopsis torques-reginae]QYX33061.1 zinc ribbon domain-containing protein [Sphaerospermopsis torques-reginae ITEP-024]